jgi:hypothetical protein
MCTAGQSNAFLSQLYRAEYPSACHWQVSLTTVIILAPLARPFVFPSSASGPVSLPHSPLFGTASGIHSALLFSELNQSHSMCIWIPLCSAPRPASALLSKCLVKYSPSTRLSSLTPSEPFRESDLLHHWAAVRIHICVSRGFGLTTCCAEFAEALDAIGDCIALQKTTMFSLCQSCETVERVPAEVNESARFGRIDATIFGARDDYG